MRHGPLGRRGTAWWLVPLLALGAFVGLPAVPAAAASGASYVQGSAFTTSSRVASKTVSFTSAVGAGDLLVGWFAQYNLAGQVQVSDNVNGAWTRAPAATTFNSGTGDIALYYVASSGAASAGGLTATVTASGAAYFQGVVGEYSGVAASSPLDQVASGRGVGLAVTTSATPAVVAGGSSSRASSRAAVLVR